MAKLIEITGKALSGEWGTDDEIGNGIPILRTTNFTNEGVVNYDNVVTRTITKKNIAEKYLQQGDIIIEKSGGSDKQPVGRVIYFDGPDNTYLFNNFTGLLRVKDPNIWLPKYVFYSLFANYRRGGTRSFENKTTGLHNLKTDDYVSRYVVNDAEYFEQVKICEHLDRLRGIIQLLREELERLEELIKARFVEMFEQGNYSRVEFGEICEFLRNGASIKQTKGARGYPITRIETLSNDVFNTDRLGYADIFDLNKYEKYLLKPGDILISHINSVAYLGRAVQYRGQMNTPIIHGMNLLCARIVDGFNSTYIEYFFKTPMAKDYIATITKKAVNQASITTSDLKKMMVPSPGLELQNEFNRFVNQVDKSKVVVQKALDEAQLLFDSLMQKYFG